MIIPARRAFFNTVGKAARGRIRPRPAPSAQGTRNPAPNCRPSTRRGITRLDGELPPASAAALSASGHLRPRNVTLPVHEVQIAALLLDAHLCDLLSHESPPPSCSFSLSSRRRHAGLLRRISLHQR